MYCELIITFWQLARSNEDPDGSEILSDTITNLISYCGEGYIYSRLADYLIQAQTHEITKANIIETAQDLANSITIKKARIDKLAEDRAKLAKARIDIAQAEFQTANHARIYAQKIEQ